MGPSFGWIHYKAFDGPPGAKMEFANWKTPAAFDTEPWRVIRKTDSSIGLIKVAYNDGPLADGSQMGPFYELESVAPAWALAPGALKSYGHDVFHFTGPEASLDKISRSVLGVSIEQIKQVFQ